MKLSKAYPYKRLVFDNSLDSQKVIMHTEGNKLNFRPEIPEELRYNPINGNNGNGNKRKDPKLIKVNWDPIIGYISIKHLIDAALRNKNKKKTHVLLGGAAGTSKTVFLQTIESSLKQQGYNVHYLDATTLTSSGVIDYLFTNNVEYLLLDELDKLEREHQNTFLNFIESGLLQETKHKKTRKKEMKETVTIATANYLNNILNPLLTRFLVLEIPKYTKEQFYEIGQKLLIQQYGKTQESAYYIVDQIWNIYTIKKQQDPNMRQAVQVAVLTDNEKQTIDPILRGITDYSKKVEVEK